VLVLVGSAESALALAASVPPGARELMARHWPGALTLVFAARPGLPDLLMAGTGTVGIRVPGHPVALGLVRAAGCPVTAPSANPVVPAPATGVIRPSAVTRTMRARSDDVTDQSTPAESSAKGSPKEPMGARRARVSVPVGAIRNTLPSLSEIVHRSPARSNTR